MTAIIFQFGSTQTEKLMYKEEQVMTTYYKSKANSIVYEHILQEQS